MQESSVAHSAKRLTCEIYFAKSAPGCTRATLGLLFKNCSLGLLIRALPQPNFEYDIDIKVAIYLPQGMNSLVFEVLL